MSARPVHRFELRQITETEWLILDHLYSPNDPRRTVACLYQPDPDEVEVVCLRDLPLSTYYMTPAEALEDVRRCYPGAARGGLDVERSSSVRPLTGV